MEFSDEQRPRMNSNWGLGRSFPDRYPMDVFSYTREATHCFHQRRFLACIAMASSAVEIILNRDRRLKVLPNFKGRDGWTYLNNRTNCARQRAAVECPAFTARGSYRPGTNRFRINAKQDCAWGDHASGKQPHRLGSQC